MTVYYKLFIHLNGFSFSFLIYDPYMEIWFSFPATLSNLHGPAY